MIQSEADVLAQVRVLLARRKLQQCLNCGQQAHNFCTGCSLAYYCCREHQLSDWAAHRLPCHYVKKHPSILSEMSTDGAPSTGGFKGPKMTEDASAKPVEKVSDDARPKEKRAKPPKQPSSGAVSSGRPEREPRKRPSPDHRSSSNASSNGEPCYRLHDQEWVKEHPDAQISEIVGIGEHADPPMDIMLLVNWLPPYRAETAALFLRDADPWMRQILHFFENRIKLAQDRQQIISSSDWKKYSLAPTAGFAAGDEVEKVFGVRYRSIEPLRKHPYFLVSWRSRSKTWLRTSELYARQPKKALEFFLSRIIISSDHPTRIHTK